MDMLLLLSGDQPLVAIHRDETPYPSCLVPEATGLKSSREAFVCAGS